MGYRITLLPTGRSFSAEPRESLLDAGLRSGVNLPYSCAGGTCGECKARLVAGEVGAIAHHDYVIPEAEKGSGVFLLCSNAARSDLTLEVYEVHDGDELPHQEILARIASLRREGDYLLLQVRTPRTQTLRFLAGQYVRLAAPGIGECHLAVASCPCNGRVLQFHLRAEPGHPLVDFLFDAAEVGQQLEVEGPYGDFTLDESSTAPLVMVAEGSGFAPIKSLIEHVIALETGQPIYLFWVAEPGGHYQANVCRSWRDALDDFGLDLIERQTGEPPEAVARRIIGQVPAEADWYLAVDPPLRDALSAATARSRRVYPEG